MNKSLQDFSNDEAQILHALGVGTSHHEKLEIITLLRQYCNAEKVLKVLEIRGSHVCASYTIAPIITQIGNLTPEQYVTKVERAVSEFTTAQYEYIKRFSDARTGKERNAVVKRWSEYLYSIDNEGE